MEQSRIKNSARNIFWGISTQLLTFILQFIGRTVFVRVLSQEYLGINGLFCNVLNVLCFAELGLGEAIVFSMYKPFALNDTSKVKALMKFYQKASYCIGITVLVTGLLVMPCLPLIIKNQITVPESMYLIYLLYLLNSVLSYFYNYKRTIISVAQLEYVNTLYYKVTYAIQVIVQIGVLIILKNFILFLCIQIICTFMFNFSTAKKAESMFPFIKEKDAVKLSKKEVLPIKNNVKALVMYKVSHVINGSTDNILIATLIGVKVVGIASNYLLITDSLLKVISQGTVGITASIGNFNAIESKDRQQDVFYYIHFLIMWVFGFMCIGLMVCVNPLITVWFGEEFILSNLVVFSIVSQIYLIGLQFTPSIFRTTLGLLYQWKIAPLVGAIMNLVLSFWWGSHYGVFGIFFATTVSGLCTTFWVDIYTLFHYYFKKPVFSVFRRALFYTAITFVNYSITRFLVSHITILGWFGVFVKILVCAIISNLIYLLIFYNTLEFQIIIIKLKRLLIQRKLLRIG